MDLNGLMKTDDVGMVDLIENGDLLHQAIVHLAGKLLAVDLLHSHLHGERPVGGAVDDGEGARPNSGAEDVLANHPRPAALPPPTHHGVHDPLLSGVKIESF